MPRSSKGYTLEDLERKILRAATVKPKTASEIAARVGIDGYDGRALGRPIGQLVRKGSLIKTAARVPLYAKAR